MKNSFLVIPCKEYQKSFENYVLAYRRENDDYYFNKYKKALENFDEYLTDLNNCCKGVGLLQGEVRTSTLWLIGNDEAVGVVRVRHHEIGCAGHIGYDVSPDHRNKGYGTKILKLALVEAAKIGIEEAIITCDVENAASRKIIESNNGRLLGTVFDEEEDEHLYKYSIKTVIS